MRTPLFQLALPIVCRGQKVKRINTNSVCVCVCLSLSLVCVCPDEKAKCHNKLQDRAPLVEGGTTIKCGPGLPASTSAAQNVAVG